MTISPRRLLQHAVGLPSGPVPEGRQVTLPGRGGSTYVTDTPGPTHDSPAVVLLHAVGTTGRLSWYPAIPALAERFRVVTLDLPWHGRGIMRPDFSLRDCADDVAALIDVLGLDQPIVAGYSMGSIVAQRVWRQHPDHVGGLVLCATTDRFRTTVGELLFHESMELGMLALRGLARSRVARSAARAAGHALGGPIDDLHDWALAEFRSTSPWAVGQAVAALGRHHSRPWLARIDVPTAVVITRRDRVIPPGRQLDVARRIPGATILEIPAGHAACVLEAREFVPALVQACATVRARTGDQLRRTG